jgi:hypothetical protein
VVCISFWQSISRLALDLSFLDVLVASTAMVSMERAHGSDGALFELMHADLLIRYT